MLCQAVSCNKDCHQLELSDFDGGRLFARLRNLIDTDFGDLITKIFLFSFVAESNKARHKIGLWTQKEFFKSVGEHRRQT